MRCRVSLDGMNPVKVEALDEAITRARSGNGPSLLEMKNYRYRGIQCQTHKNTEQKRG